MNSSTKNNKFINFDDNYNPKVIANGLYESWLNQNIFQPDYNKPLFSCTMAPPNLTGILHIGHAWELSISDAYLRMQKMQGKNVSWAPGYDHAGISTQVKFEQSLSNPEERKKYFNFTRQQKIDAIMKWSLINSEKIINQIKTLGIIVDWNNFHFTLDENSKYAVKYAFKNLYEKGYIYQEKKIVNWDVFLNTAISNIEVVNKPTEQFMYYVSYQFVDSNDSITVATTRPETIFVDAAIFVNPNDNRYKNFVNKMVVNPLTNAKIKIFADNYVDPKFGTGVMKCTPAHDVNDYKLGKKYGLLELSCINYDGKLNELAGQFANIDRIQARNAIVKFLQENKKITKIEKIISNVSYSERSNTIIEPLLSKQWFIKLSAFASNLQIIIDNSDKFNIIPKNFKKLMQKWLIDCEDWCISRQLIWGHQIPVWYHKVTKNIFVDINPPEDIQNYEQDPDVLDTWFSSSLWPLICYGWPNINQKLFKNGYPNSLMIMGFDIIFFWGIKMMFQGVFHTEQLPFNTLLIHGLIRDENGKKMSKSLGNVIDPNTLIDKYGADALRIYLTSNTSLGEDTNYQEKKIQNAANLLIKIWNASKYIYKLTDNNLDFKDLSSNDIDTNLLNDADKWILKEYENVLNKVTNLLNNFEFTLANKYLYNFIWNDFCNTYLDYAKVTLDTEHRMITILILRYLLLKIIHMLHPFAPFLTDKIYQIFIGDNNKFLLQNNWPQTNNWKLETNFNVIIEMITALRNFRNKAKLNLNHSLKINIIVKDSKLIDDIKKSILYFKLVNSEVCNIVLNKNKNSMNNMCILGSIFEILIIDDNFKNVLNEILLKKIEKLQFEVNRSKTILSNESFIKNAPKEKVQQEKEKLKQYEKKLVEALKEKKN